MADRHPQLAIAIATASAPDRGSSDARAGLVALLTVWLGVIMLVASIVFIFLPGSRDPRGELEHRLPYSLADRFLPVPIYGVTVTLFIGIVVLWQMRREPRPLPDGLVIRAACRRGSGSAFHWWQQQSFTFTSRFTDRVKPQKSPFFGWLAEPVQSP